MAKLKVDPKKMEVIKKTVVTTAPSKPKYDLKFFDDEIARHDKLAKEYHDAYMSKLNYPKSGPDYEKYVQVNKNRDFLEKQKAALESKIEKQNAANKALKEKKAKEAYENRPIGQKVMDFIKTTGGSGGLAGS